MMTLKCNNLVDRQLTMKLYEASQAGWKSAIVRGMCSLLPGVSGVSENIEAISIIDRYLNIPSVCVPQQRADICWVSDLMTRNIDYRVEVLCPIRDAAIQNQLQDILDQQWHDNTKARVLDKDQANALRDRGDHARAAGAGNGPSLPLPGKEAANASLADEAGVKASAIVAVAVSGRKQPGFNVSQIQNHNLLRSRILHHLCRVETQQLE